MRCERGETTAMNDNNTTQTTDILFDAAGGSG